MRTWPSSPGLLAPLLPWFETRGRRLPWRAVDLEGEHPDPYAVLVSELMLQQTQVSTVIPYFEAWMRRFPDLVSLAEADPEEVLGHWQGLGYYRRARHLQAAARRLSSGGWPREPRALERLPGVGPYTAAALASIAFQLPVPALDGNLYRVLARLLHLRAPRAHGASLRTWLAPALATLGPSRVTQALMDLGALVCVPGTPNCPVCPLAGACRSLAKGDQEGIPLPVQRPAPKEVELWLLALEWRGRWLLSRPRERGLLSGLWRWPESLSGGGDGTTGTQVPSGVQVREIPGWVQIYTHRRERVRPLHVRVASPPPHAESFTWVTRSRLASLPMGRRDQRLRKALADGDGSDSCSGVPLGRILSSLA
ncbi:MAG: A/G-specific adenine glycosylase [Acidobacteria bacterium]|nr:A/G-specific adenine glycosylase [Acidobacteriota bacterium]